MYGSIANRFIMRIAKMHTTILTADRVQTYSCKDMFMVQIYKLVRSS